MSDFSFDRELFHKLQFNLTQRAKRPSLPILPFGALSLALGIIPGQTVIAGDVTVFVSLPSPNGSGTVTIAGAGGEAITCPDLCQATFPSGTDVTLTATPDSVSSFLKWVGGCYSTKDTCSFKITTNTTVKAFFKLIPTHIVNVEVNGRGKVTSEPEGINCGNNSTQDCEWRFQHGKTVILTAENVSDSSFQGWSGDCLGNKTTCELTVDKYKTVKAKFIPIIPHRLIINKPGIGASKGLVKSNPPGIDCGATCENNFSLGPVELTATAEYGYGLANWTIKPTTAGACDDPTLSCTVDISSLRTTVTAEFIKIPKKILNVNRTGQYKNMGSVVSDPPGINCGKDCREPYLYNTPVTLTATPNSGFGVLWHDACESSGKSTVCVVNMNTNWIAGIEFTLQK